MLVHGWLMTRAVENDQHHEEIINNIPEGPPDPPAPPDKPASQQNVPLSIELEGERRLVMSSEDACISDEVDASGASGHIEDARKWPKNLWNVSECVREQLEQRGKENSPRRAPDEPYNPGGKAAIPGGVHDVQECPRSVSSECANEMDTLH